LAFQPPDFDFSSVYVREDGENMHSTLSMFSMFEDKFPALIAKPASTIEGQAYRRIDRNLDYCTDANPATWQPNAVDHLSDS
jgi:hypothetical protein